MRVVGKKSPVQRGPCRSALAPSKDWAYSTVKITMDRMAKKGLLKLKRIRNLQLFSAAVSEADAKRGEFHKMLKRLLDGAPEFPDAVSDRTGRTYAGRINQAKAVGEWRCLPVQK